MPTSTPVQQRLQQKKETTTAANTEAVVTTIYIAEVFTGVTTTFTGQTMQDILKTITLSTKRTAKMSRLSNISCGEVSDAKWQIVIMSSAQKKQYHNGTNTESDTYVERQEKSLRKSTQTLIPWKSNVNIISNIIPVPSIITKTITDTTIRIHFYSHKH